MIFLDNWQTQEYKATKKQIVRLLLNEKAKGIQTRLMSLYWKKLKNLKKGLDNNIIIVILGL